MNTNVVTFYNLALSGINPAAVAWYRFTPQGERVLYYQKVDGQEHPVKASDAVALLEIQTVSGAELQIEGDEAQELFDRLRNTSSHLSEEKQNAIESLRAFFAAAFTPFVGVPGSYGTSGEAIRTAEEALSILGAD